MSNLEFVGKINSPPFISLAKEEKMRVEDIKRRIMKEKAKAVFTQEQVELTYERDTLDDYERPQEEA